MWDNIKNYQNHPFLKKLGDFTMLVQIGFLIIVLLVTYSGLKVIQTNYELQQRLSRLEQEIAVQKLENNNLKLRNEYYNTPQYLELAARQNYGLAFPGEKELIVPKEVALAQLPKAVDDTPTVRASINDQPAYQKNLQAWMNFFLNRSDAI